MKKMKRLTILMIIIILTVSAFSGCKLINNIMYSPDVILRIEAFELTLNTSPRVPSAIAANFAPAPTTEMANQMTTSDFWDAKFDIDSEFDFTDINTLDFDDVKATMVETYNGTAYDPIDVSFKMVKNDDGDWVIEEYYEAGDNIIKHIYTK